MGVVRLDDNLLKKVKQVLKEEANKYKYGSVSAFINVLVYEKLKGTNISRSIKKNE